MRILMALLMGLVCAVARADEPQFGLLKGKFVYDGEAPLPREAIWAGVKIPDESLVVDAKTRGIANIVIMLIAKEPPKHPEWEKLVAEETQLKAERFRYEPHVCRVLTGQDLQFANRDPVGHNLKVDFLITSPENELIPALGELRKSYRVSERLPVSVNSSIFPWMKGYLVVTDHPYVAVTNTTGEFAIKDLPPGEWTFRVWQERAGFIRQVVRDDVAQEWPKGRFTVQIKPGIHDLGEMKISPKTFKE